MDAGDSPAAFDWPLITVLDNHVASFVSDPMPIEKDADDVLLHLASYRQGDDDPEAGRYWFKNHELGESMGMNPARISDAVDFLARRGLVQTLGALGSHPFSFIQVCATTEGRVEAERLQQRRSGVRDADIDGLTGLLNRERLDRDLHAVQSTGPVVVLMIDLDHFKSVNDTYCHPTGDAVLKSAAGTVTSIVGRKGRCYRYGGEEFTVLLENYTQDEAAPLAERIRRAIEELKVAPVPQITASIGGASAHGQKVGDVLKAADKALYGAKDSGRNRVVWFQEG